MAKLRQRTRERDGKGNEATQNNRHEEEKHKQKPLERLNVSDPPLGLAPCQSPLSDAGSADIGHFTSKLGTLVAAEMEDLRRQAKEAKRQKYEMQREMDLLLKQDMILMQNQASEMQGQVESLVERLAVVQANMAEMVSSTRQSASNSSSTPNNDDDENNDTSRKGKGKEGKGKIRRQRGLQRKVFVVRDSMLSRLLLIPEFETIYNIFVAALLIFGISVLMDEYLDKSKFMAMVVKEQGGMLPV